MHRVRLPRWASLRGAALNDFHSLAPGRTALVVIDMQTVFMTEGQPYANRHARDIVANVNALAGAMRAAGAPVIWTRQTHTHAGPLAPAPWQYDERDTTVASGVAGLQAGSPGQALHPDMDVAPHDAIVDKYRYGAFSCPARHLPHALEARGVEMIVLAGTTTNCCCETTAREANMAGYKVLVVADATAAVTDIEHNAALLNLRVNFADVRRTREVLGMIAAMGRA